MNAMRQILTLLFMFAVALHAQLPTNLDCKCTATGDGEYLCKCVPSKGTPETLPKTTAQPTPSSTTTTTPSTVPTAAKTNETPTGTTTTKGQPIYTGPRGGQYHYSDSGKKVYTRKK